jgi:small subunit ribosomal protein S16
LVKIRLRRMGTSKKPVYRVVVCDSHVATKGKFFEEVGFYDPKKDIIQLNKERIEFWVKKGAQLSDTVDFLFKGRPAWQKAENTPPKSEAQEPASQN